MIRNLHFGRKGRRIQGIQPGLDSLSALILGNDRVSCATVNGGIFEACNPCRRQPGARDGGPGARTARIRWTIVAAVLITALGPALGGAGAAPSLVEPPADAQTRPDSARLDGIRERLIRREALHHLFVRWGDDLALEIEELSLRADEAAAALGEARESLRSLERRLDQLAPRLLARSAALRDRRAQAGRALAELATMSRQVQLDPTQRARLLAISPVLLTRLWGAEASLAALDQEHERVAERHRELWLRTPMLQAEQRRLQRQREQKKDAYRSVLVRLEELDQELARLTGEEQRLAQVVLRAEQADALTAGPQADQPTLVPAAASPVPVEAASSAAIKGLALREGHSAPSADAIQPKPAKVVATVPSRVSAQAKPSLLGGAGMSFLPPPAKPLEITLKGDVASPLPAASHDAVGLAAPVEIAMREALPDQRPAMNDSMLARLPDADAPLVPVLAKGLTGFEEAMLDQGVPWLTFEALPGQRVAAPEAGRVVFADTFKSYGLLLIIEHDSEYHTLLWAFSRLDVEVGDRVQTGQIVGVMGAGRGDGGPKLHVELRRQGRPVNPLPWLTASNSKVRG